METVSLEDISVRTYDIFYVRNEIFLRDKEKKEKKNVKVMQ